MIFRGGGGGALIEIDNDSYEDASVAAEDGSSRDLALPWRYSPITDPSMCLRLVEELLHLIIMLIMVRKIQPLLMFLLLL